MLTFVVTGPIVEHSGPQAALLTANGLYAVVFVMCFLLGFVRCRTALSSSGLFLSSPATCIYFYKPVHFVYFLHLITNFDIVLNEQSTYIHIIGK
ncbi:hypothetical protein AWP60_05525 [Escherichia coli]|nr:hypothetical protein AWP60_05525 [Escherichia coli]